MNLWSPVWASGMPTIRPQGYQRNGDAVKFISPSSTMHSDSLTSAFFGITVLISKYGLTHTHNTLESQGIFLPSFISVCSEGCMPDHSWRWHRQRFFCIYKIICVGCCGILKNNLLHFHQNCLFHGPPKSFILWTVSWTACAVGYLLYGTFTFYSTCVYLFCRQPWRVLWSLPTS